MGTMQVPENALYAAQTARAVENFPISGQTIGRDMIRALGIIKQACARVNHNLGKLGPEMTDAIVAASEEVIQGKLDTHFPVDVFQTGSGTSSNMNANEVIANRAMQISGIRGIHPNDHVNLGQSSNDVFPTAIHLAGMMLIEHRLKPALEEIQNALAEKAEQFESVVKTARTHLQDATPIRLGQEFSGFASQIEHGIGHLTNATQHLIELPIGGTAVGTGINTHPEFGQRVCDELSKTIGIPFIEAANHFEAQSAKDAVVQTSASLKTIATSLIKIANDIRWLGSGPRLGLGELDIPAVQPGSSIMPGKVNPVMAEAMIMVAVQVIANDCAITLGGLYGNFQLNTMMPLMARNFLEQIRLLSNTCPLFASKLLRGLKANQARIQSLNEQSLGLATALAPIIGYDRAAEIAKKAYQTGKTVKQVVLEENLMTAEQLDTLLDLRRLTKPNE